MPVCAPAADLASIRRGRRALIFGMSVLWLSLEHFLAEIDPFLVFQVRCRVAREIWRVLQISNCTEMDIA